MVRQYLLSKLKNILKEQNISVKGFCVDSYYRLSVVYLNLKWIIKEGMKMIRLRIIIIVDGVAMEE